MKFQTYYGPIGSFDKAMVIEADSYQAALAKTKSYEPEFYLKEELAERFNIHVQEPDKEQDNNYYPHEGV